MALALSASMSALPALAQHGPHRFGGHEGGGLAHAIIALKTELNLSASQQAALDAAIAAGKVARQAAHASMQTVHQLATDEFAKPTPDLARIAAAQDQAQDAATKARRDVRNQLLALYGTFTPAQVQVIKDAFAKRMSHMQSFRQHLRERLGNN